ncbi:hypothetical protein OGA_03096 [Enterococcus faecium EnGen0012]|nr:hypothetical protein OGA_03096 [Enterococcus faecium EnGen0012]
MHPKAPQKVTVATSQAGETGHYTIGGTYTEGDNVTDVVLKRVDGRAVSVTKTVEHGTFSIDWNISSLTPSEYKLQVIAKNAVGDSEPTDVTVTLTQQMINGAVSPELGEPSGPGASETESGKQG